MNPRMKRAVARMLSRLPGSAGERFETSALWAERAMRARSSKGDFAVELARLTRNDICIDLGANVGAVTRELAAVAGHVHAFEPDPWAFRELSGNTRDLGNVTLHNAAIGPSDGALKLLQDPGLADAPELRSQGSSAYRSLLWERGEPTEVEVEMIGIGGFLRSLGRPVALMKIDIEGAEVALLEALLDSPEVALVDVVFVETHECQIPELRAATKALRARVASIDRPRFYLEWH